MNSRTLTIPVKLPNGKLIRLEATDLGGEQDIASQILSLDGVIEAIEGVSTAISESLERIKPHKASIEFALEIATESGQLTALLVKGSGKASLKITLHWEK